MWRSVIVCNGNKLALKDYRLVVFEDEKSSNIPIDDLHGIVIDNQEAVLTVPLLSCLAEKGVHAVICDKKHLPVGIFLPLNIHYKSYGVLKDQMRLDYGFCGEVWKEIVQAKIYNQASVLSLVGVETEIVDRMKELSYEVLPHDTGNREGVAAKMFFRALYGSSFIRFEDDSINSAINYGYAILRSSVAKFLVSHGLNCALGVHHISETNPFNLADDFMEPYRPYVDLTVVSNPDLFSRDLTKKSRRELIDLLNKEVCYSNSTMKMRYAIDAMVKSFLTSIDRKDAKLCRFPSFEIMSDESENYEIDDLL